MAIHAPRYIGMFHIIVVGIIGDTMMGGWEWRQGWYRLGPLMVGVLHIGT